MYSGRVTGKVAPSLSTCWLCTTLINVTTVLQPNLIASVCNVKQHSTALLSLRVSSLVDHALQLQGLWWWIIISVRSNISLIKIDWNLHKQKRETTKVSKTVVSLLPVKYTDPWQWCMKAALCLLFNLRRFLCFGK